MSTGYEVIRSYSKIVHLPIDCTANDLEKPVVEALSTINGTSRTKTVKKLSQGEEKWGSLKSIVTTVAGAVSYYGDENWMYKVNNNWDKSSGVSIIRKEVRLGQVSRLGIAWWTDNGNCQKVFRVFGDRIKLTVAHPTTPRLFALGVSSYHVVYPNSKANPDQCFKCNASLKNVESFHIENPQHFLCAVCKYLHDTGFLPARLGKRKRTK